MGDDAQERFEQLWTGHHRRVLAFALRRTDRATAEDVVAETFLVAWRRREEMPSGELPWLLGIARLTLRNAARSRRRQDALVAAQEHVVAVTGGHGDPAAIDHDVLHALAELTELDRDVLMLTAWDGLTTSEAARVLGATPTTVRVRLLRARRRLAALLAQAAAPLPRPSIRSESAR